MLNELYFKITSLNLAGLIAAYVGLIFVYTQLPEAVWVIRPFLSGCAQLMIIVILLNAIEKIRQA